MKGRIDKWTNERESLQLSIEEIREKLPPLRLEKFSKSLKEKIDAAKSEWNHHYTFLKRKYEEDMKSGATQFLLKFDDNNDDDDEDFPKRSQKKSKNVKSRGHNQSQRWRGGRGPYKY